jgi:hypothetical protein
LGGGQHGLIVDQASEKDGCNHFYLATLECAPKTSNSTETGFTTNVSVKQLTNVSFEIDCEKWTESDKKSFSARQKAIWQYGNHAQDSIQLVEKLMRLEKTQHFEAMFYPSESHAFTRPTSWADEYERIFWFFERHLKN